MDDIKPARMLTRGASEDAKEKVARVLQEIQDRKNEIMPEVERTKRKEEELLIETQNSQQRAKDSREQIRMFQKSMTKLDNIKRKLKDAEAKLETDDEEEKQKQVDKLKQRVLVSLKAMSAHSESYKQMMDATVKASGAKLNKEIMVVQERVSRYVLF